jgi:site-specific recombinase XerD
MSNNQGSPGTEIEPRQDTSPALTDGLSPLARAAIAAGVPASTWRAYDRDWKAFEAWCAGNGRTSLPAATGTVIEYVTHLCYGRVPMKPDGTPIRGKTGLSPSSVNRARSAIVKVHQLAGIDPPPMKVALQVVKGYESFLAESRDKRARPQQATAVSRATLQKLAEVQDENKLIGLRDRAMLLLAYSTAARVSELVSLNIEDVAITPDGLLVSVYRKKTRRHDEPAIPLTDAPLAIRAVREWLEALAEHGRTSGPLFVRIDKHGNLGASAYHSHRKAQGRPDGDSDGRITTGAAEQRIKRAAKLAGLEGRWTIHSTRRGYATEARKAGHDNIRIARHGGWDDNSPVLARYMEDADKWTDNPLKGAGL